MVELSQGIHGYAVSFEYVSMKKVLDIPNSAMAFSGRGSDLNVLAVCTWPADENTPENEKKAKEGVAAFSKIVEAEGKEDDVSGSSAEPRAYGNYCKCCHFIVSLLPHFSLEPRLADGGATTSADKAKQLFGSNYPKLQQLKNKYDPKNIFNKWYPIIPDQA